MSRIVRSGQQLCAHLAHHLVHGGETLDAEEFRHVERADLRDQRDVVAQQVDDHAVLGLVLRIVGEEVLQLLVLFRRLAARCRALHRMRLDPAVAVDLEEQFGRTRQDHRTTEIDQCAVFHRLPRRQRVEGRQRVAGPFCLDRKGQVRLVAVALAQMPVHAVETFLVVLERPGRAYPDDRSVGLRPPVLRQRLIGRAVEDAEHHQRRAPVLRDDRRQLRLQQIARLVGKITGQPLSRVVRFLRGLQRRKKILDLLRDDDLSRTVEEHFVAGKVVAEEDVGGGGNRHAPPSGLPAISPSRGEIKRSLLRAGPAA